MPPSLSVRLAKRVGSWIGKECVSLSHRSAEELAYDEQFFESIRHSSEAILWYLEHVVLKQITTCSAELSVNSHHLLNGFNRITLFSADPEDEALYGIEKSDQTDHTKSPFLAHAAHKVLEPNNKQIVTFPYLTSPLECAMNIYCFDCLDFKTSRQPRARLGNRDPPSPPPSLRANPHIHRHSGVIITLWYSGLVSTRLFID